MIFVLSFISIGLELWLVNNNLIYKNWEPEVFMNIIFFREISNNWPNDLTGFERLEEPWILLIITIDSITIY